MEYATEVEMIEHCVEYPCNKCPIANRCSMFEKLFGYLPDAAPIEITPETEKAENEII